MKSLDDVAREFVGLFEAENIPYVLMGGFAVRAHALPRATYDVDFTILLSRTELPRLYRLMENLGYTVPAQQWTGWVDTVKELPVIKFQVFLGNAAIDVDLFLAETSFQRQLLTRRQKHYANALEAWFVTPEDLILLKLLAGRPKDLVDVGDILFIQGQPDPEYLRRWAIQMGILPVLEEALRRAAAAE